MPRASESQDRARDEFRKRMADSWRAREINVISAEVGPIPDVRFPDRKEACRNDLLLFLTGRDEQQKTKPTIRPYFPDTTGKHPVSQDHVAFIRRLESSVLQGGKLCEAVYRGFGKTSIGEGATVWASLYGHQRFSLVASADNPAAEDVLENIRNHFESNDELAVDFPEACHPLRALDNKFQRTHSQTVDGELTKIVIRRDELRLPTVAGAASSGAIIKSKSLLTVNRGMKHGGLRVGWVFIDDPQTDDSALSSLQTQKRLDKLYKTILWLGGHLDSRLSVFIAGSVIRPFDMMAQLLDAELHPSWRGLSTPMIRSWAEKGAHEKLWLGEYAKLRSDFDRGDPDAQERAHKKATRFYRKHREAMDAGVQVSWKHCFSAAAHEISATQHAYNLLIDTGEETFSAECQGQPGFATTAVARPDPRALAKKQHGSGRGTVPSEAVKLTAYVDIQKKMLYYLVCGWTMDGTGYIVDYGSFPDQNSRYFTLMQARITLRRIFRDADQDGLTTQGLDRVVGELLDRRFTRADGDTMQIDKLMIDSAWLTDCVKRFVRDRRSRVVRAARGVGIGPLGKTLGEYNLNKGCMRGRDWIETRPRGDPVKVVQFDSNAWKTAVAEGLNLEYGSRGSISLYKAQPAEHRMAVDHFMAETSERLTSDRRSCIVWTLPRPDQDNHLLDCLVGSAVAASLCGVDRLGKEKKPRRRAKIANKRKATYL